MCISVYENGWYVKPAAPGPTCLLYLSCHSAAWGKFRGIYFNSDHRGGRWLGFSSKERKMFWKNRRGSWHQSQTGDLVRLEGSKSISKGVIKNWTLFHNTCWILTKIFKVLTEWEHLQYLLLYSATKGVKRKGVFYVFLYKQKLDNVYTQTTIHRFTMSPLHPADHGCWASTPSAPLFFS